MSTKIFSVYEVTHQIKNILENQFSSIEVQGEVTNYKVSSTGHIYFSLKDEKATLNCVLFKSKFQSESIPFKNGDLLIARGSLGVYEPSGTYQLIVKSIAKAGIGEILAKIQALKEHFQKKGYFDPSQKLPIPKLPKKIGIVTALTGAVLQDIIKVLKRRVHSYHLIVYPVKVQGEGAALEIKEAIDTLNHLKLTDVIILARGGGSFEDLLPFNDPLIVEAIHHSKIPIISAIGHEIDYTLSDFVSDLRAPTPSSAAEMVCLPTLEIISKITHLLRHIQEKQLSLVSKTKKNFETKVNFLYQKGISHILTQNQMRIDSIAERIDNALSYKVERSREKLKFVSLRLNEKNPALEQTKKRDLLIKLDKNIKNHLSKIISQKKQKDALSQFSKIENALCFQMKKKREILNSFEKRLQALNPKMILKKGYCIPFYQNTQSIILSSEQIQETAPFDLMFHDGIKTVELSSSQRNLTHE